MTSRFEQQCYCAIRICKGQKASLWHRPRLEADSVIAVAIGVLFQVLLVVLIGRGELGQRRTSYLRGHVLLLEALELP